MQMKVGTILRIVEALEHFDAPNKEDVVSAVTKTFTDNATSGVDVALRKVVDVVIEQKRPPYKLAVPVRYAMAKNLSRLRREVAIYESCRKDLVREHSAVGGAGVAADKLGAFTKAHEQLLDASCEINLICFTEPLLQLDVNDIPMGILASLMPIMKDAGGDEVAAPAGMTAQAA